MTAADGSYKAYVFPRPNYLYHRRATVHLDNESVRIELRDGSTVFDSTLRDLAATNVHAFAPARVPYVMLVGSSGQIRLGFASTVARNVLLLVALTLAPALVLAALDQFVEAPSDVVRSIAAGVTIMAGIAAAQSSVRPGDGPAFAQRLLDLVPGIDKRVAEVLPGQMGLGAKMAYGSLALLVDLVYAPLLTMVSSLALRPFAPTDGTDSDGFGMRVVLLVFFLVGLPLYYWNRFKIDAQSGRDPVTGHQHVNWAALLAPVGLAAALLAIYGFRRAIGV